jgi:hypothetical protein
LRPVAWGRCAGATFGRWRGDLSSTQLIEPMVFAPYCTKPAGVGGVCWAEIGRYQVADDAVDRVAPALNDCVASQDL